MTSTGAHVKQIHGLIQCVLNAAGGFYGTDVKTDSLNPGLSSCGSVVEHCVSSAKVVGSIPMEVYSQNVVNVCKTCIA